MNRKFWIGWLVVFVLWMAAGYLVHEVLLGPEYRQLTTLFRPPEEASGMFACMVVARLLMAGAFTWIYSRGVTGGPWLGQGLRFGIAIALLAVIPVYLIYYAVQPIPGGLAHRQMIYDSIVVIVLGLVIAAVYRSRPAAA